MKKYLKILVIVFILIPIYKVNALSLANITVTCDPDANNNIICTIKGNTDSSVNRFEANIQISTGGEIVTFTPSNRWSGGYNNNHVSINASSNDVTNDFDIGTFRVSSNSSVDKLTVLVSDPVFTGSDETTQSAENQLVNINLTAIRGNPIIDSIKVNGGIMSPQLTEDNFTYNIHLTGGTAENPTFSMVVTPKNINDEIEAYNGDTGESIDLNNITYKTSSGKSSMQLIIKVKSSDNTSKDYTIIVSRILPELASLTVGDMLVPLQSGIYEYQIALEDVTSYTVDATLKYSDYYTFSSYLTFPATFSDEKEFSIPVVPKDNSLNLSGAEYTIKVIKKTGASSNEEPTSTPTPIPPSSSNAGNNPGTGTSATVVGLILVVSLFISFYLYRNNMNKYNETN